LGISPYVKYQGWEGAAFADFNLALMGANVLLIFINGNMYTL
jgi:hypothetical protein